MNRRGSHCFTRSEPFVPSRKAIYSPCTGANLLHITSSLPSNLLLSGQRPVNPFNDAFRVRVSLEDRQRPIPWNHQSPEGWLAPRERREFSEKGSRDFVAETRTDLAAKENTLWLPFSIPLRESTTFPGNRLCQRYEERVPDKFETFRGICRPRFIPKVFPRSVPFIAALPDFSPSLGNPPRFRLRVIKVEIMQIPGTTGSAFFSSLCH